MNHSLRSNLLLDCFSDQLQVIMCCWCDCSDHFITCREIEVLTNPLTPLVGTLINFCLGKWQHQYVIIMYTCKVHV